MKREKLERPRRSWKNNWFVLALRYMINIPALTMIVLLRCRIGTDCFAPWFWGEHGRDKGQYAPRQYIRVLSIVYLYIWVRSFMLINVAYFSPSFNNELWKNWADLFRLYWPTNGANVAIYAATMMTGFFNVLSWVIPIVAVLQLTLVPYLRGEAHQNSLGRSTIFSWLVRRRSTAGEIKGIYLVRGTLEPLLTGLIGLIFMLSGYVVHAWFFWISGTCMALQAHYRDRMLRWTQKEGAFDDSERKRAKSLLNAPRSSEEKSLPVFSRKRRRK